MRLLWEQVYRLGYVSLGLPHHLFTTSSEPYSVCCSLMTDHSRIMPRKFPRVPPILTSVHDAGLKKYTTIYPWLLHTHIKTIWCLMYLLVPTCQTSTSQVKILSCPGIRMAKWWVLKQFCESPDVAWPSRPTRLKMEKFPHNERSRAVEPPTDCIAFDHTLQPNICHHTMRQNSATQIRFLTLYIFAIIQMRGGTTWKNFPFPDAQNPVWWHSWHFGQCLVCTIPEYTGGIIFSHLLHSRHDKDDKVLEVEIERSSVWSNLELEAPTCAGSLDISFFPPHLTLWRNSFQFWPEDRLVGFITPPAPLDFRLIGSQAICCRLFFC